MAAVRSLPACAARRLKPHSPGAARALSRLQMDSPLVLSFASVCIAVQFLSTGAMHRHLFQIAKPVGISPTAPFRLVGHVFGHAGWSHLQGNLILLMVAGPPCEAAFGAPRLSKVMLWTALASSASHVALAPAQSVQMGASGVVFAMILLNSWLQRDAARVPATFVLTSALWLSRELASPAVGVSHSAHLVGAAVGTYFGSRVHLRRTWWGTTTRDFEE